MGTRESKGNRQEEFERSGKPMDMNEASPNPHNEADVAETPIKTDHRESGGAANVSQNPSTREGRLNPSVAEGVAEPNKRLDDDSMFNNADPQTRIIEEHNVRNVNEKRESDSHRDDTRQEKTKPRKSA